MKQLGNYSAMARRSKGGHRGTADGHPMTCVEQKHSTKMMQGADVMRRKQRGSPVLACGLTYATRNGAGWDCTHGV